MSRGKHLIGKVLNSCVLERVLGYGGSSAVFFAQQHNPERKVAIKVFLPRTDMDSKIQSNFHSRFLHEARAASKLDHPNILPIYAYGEQNGLPYIMMPYMSGGTLSEYIAKHGPLSLHETQWYLEQVASALDYAHMQGCVHCDVKPSNILLDSDGRAILSDFGIARLIHPAESTTAAKNLETLMGTPDYISPEQALGRAVDGRSDVYSLGITLFYLLAKRLPFVADSMLALALLHVHEAPPSLALIRVDISPTLDRVVHKALAKEPEKRFQTAGELTIAFTQAVTSADKPSAMTLIGRHAALLSASPDLATNTTQSIMVASEPFVQVKSLHASEFAKPRLVAIGILLLLLLFIAGYTMNLIAAHSAHDTTILSPATVISLDYLTDHMKWPRSKTFFYDNQRYHVLNNSTQAVALALCSDNQFSTFSLTVTMSQLRNAIHEADYYGIVFRSNSDQSHYYLFEVLTRTHGGYVFSRFDNGRWSMIASGPAPSLLPGLGQRNIITINAVGNNFAFYVNKQLIGRPTSDPSKSPLRSGLIGLYVEEQGAEVAFSHLYIVPPKMS